MTLLVTVLTKRTIYQSADFRLTNPETGMVVSDTSTKLVTLQYGEWDGFIAYTGIGRWKKRDTSEFVMQWLDGLYPATPAAVAGRIRDKGSEWLSEIEVVSGRQRHTFILASFNAGTAQLSVISNFEDCFGRNDAKAGPALTVSNTRFAVRPRVVVSGWKSAVGRQQRRRLERLINDLPEDPGRVRRMLAKLNAAAAQSSEETKKWISSACSVVSVRADGQGVYSVDGAVDIHVMGMGMRMPDVKELARRLGFEGRVAGMTFASSKPRIPYEQCRPRTITPSDAGEYVVREASHEDLASCRAVDVSKFGLVLGAGNLPGRPGDSVLWTAPLDGELIAGTFIAEPGGINDAGEVVAKAKMSDGSEHAVRWRADVPADLGCFRGKDSGAVAINAAGMVVGWVCLDPVNRGQINFRPAAWSLDQMHVLEDFGCDWGQAVDVNDMGAVLIVGYVGNQCRTIMWDPFAGTTEIVGGVNGIYPSAITSHGTVLGTARDKDGESVACLANPGQRWERLGTAPGFYATAMNDARDVVGAAVRDGFEQPWLRRASGEILWLPYFAHHWCRPRAINNSDVVVGTAQTDHGAHALIWTGRR